MTKRTIEIRSGEGGLDARLFVADLAEAYLKLATRKGWKYRADRAPDPRSGHQSIILAFEGTSTERLDNETGGHRLQRIPPTERRGRVHSSTVTVAVLGPAAADLHPFQRRQDDDYTIVWFSGTVGAGGQNHQKTQNCARVTHVPSGLVKTAQTRSRRNSLKLAMLAINQELDRLAGTVLNAIENKTRREQVGSGERSDKRRTFRFQDGLVLDHVTQKRITVDRFMNGQLDLLWPGV